MAKNKGSKHEVDGKDQETRRKLLKGIAGSVPVILTMANRPAFGQICTPSAAVSANPANPSGLDRHGDACTQGFSAGAWKTASGDGDGNLDDWHMAVAHPNPEYEASPQKNPKTKGQRATVSSHPATKFDEAFGFSSFGETLHDALLTGNQSKGATPLQRQAAAALLNARYNENTGAFPGYMSSTDVKLLYEAAYNGWSSYTNASGYIVDISSLDVTEFFRRTTR